MNKTHDIIVPLYDYKTPGGDKKTKWLNVGRIFDDKGKILLKIDCIPTQICAPSGESVPWDGWLKAFEADDDQNPLTIATKKVTKPRKPRKIKNKDQLEVPF